MLDIFPFPDIKEGKPEKQVADLVSYLIQFKEILEFALTNISEENLSPTLISKLNQLGISIDESVEVAQSSAKSLTVSDVVNSDIFKLAIKTEKIKDLLFNVNFETGHLDYNLTFEEENDG